MAGEAHIKGIAIQAIVPGLKAIPGGAQAVPPELQRYLDETILPSAWYPERDYVELLSALSRCVEPAVLGGMEVWEFFGRAAAQRDIAGSQTQVPSRSRVDRPGTYRHIREGNPRDVARVLSRLKAVWHLYHDSGKVIVTRHASHPYTVVVRVLDYEFSLPGLITMQSAYACEAARLLGMQLVERALVRSRQRGDAYYEWHYEVEQTPERAAALQLLPLVE